MYRIVRADRANLGDYRKRDWVIICGNSFTPQEGLWIDPQFDHLAYTEDHQWINHGSMSPGFSTKRFAKSMLDAGEVDWCDGCQWEKDQEKQEVS